MSRVFNERTKTWTEERLATVAAVDAWVVDLKNTWVPHGWYLRDWDQMRDQIHSVVLLQLRYDRTSRRAIVLLRERGYWPCLNLAQFMIRGDRLIGFFYWRSSSTAEREEDNKFMKWVTYQVATLLDGIRTATIVAFRASDHETLEDSDERQSSS